MSDARIVRLIRTSLLIRGAGTDIDPKRRTVQFWTLGGELVFEYDPFASGECADGMATYGTVGQAIHWSADRLDGES